MTCKGWRSKYDVEDESRSAEVNGNSCLGKRKRSRMKKHGDYLQEWLDKSWAFQQDVGLHGFEDEPSGGFRSCWPPSHPTLPVTERRLYPTVSEPAMCRYSVPVGYSLEPISLPVYAAYVPMPASSSRRRGGRPVTRPNGSSMAPLPSQVRKDSRRVPPRPQPSANEEFTSLPPATSSHTPDTVRRRFSDPGIGRSSDTVPAPCCSADSSDSGDTCSRTTTPEPNRLVQSLVDQVNAQQDSIKQLYQELHETKAELETLKQSVNQHPPGYEPGMLTDLIRDIRDAARVREEALISTVCSMIEGAGKTNHELGLAHKSKSSQKVDSIVEQLQHLRINREKTKLSSEEVDDGTTDNQTEELCALELENLQLRRSLQETVARSKERESQAQRLEHLVDVLKRKINGVSVDEKFASSEQSPSESLVSTVSSSSTNHSPQVTMSGPVTDL